MIEIRRTREFDVWLRHLRDRRALTRIEARLERVRAGHIGDVRSVGDRVSEMRIDHGPGYRLYFHREGVRIVILLCGGDKSSQDRDILRAKELAAAWRESAR